MTKRTILRVYAGIFVVVGLFWWPLSHWFYPDWYHDLLGFDALTDGEYTLVKAIGTLAVFPILGMAFIARDPERNRDFFVSLLIVSALMAATYLYLMATGDFPSGEWVNVVLISVNMGILTWLYPWQAANSH